MTPTCRPTATPTLRLKLIVATVALAWIGVSVLVAAFTTAPAPNGGADLDVYLTAIRSMLAGNGLYVNNLAGGGFLYPPFAAALMAPFAYVPIGQAWAGWKMIQIGLTTAVAILIGVQVRWFREMSLRKILAGMAALCLLLAARAPMSSVYMGQINMLIIAMVLVDQLLLPQKWRGALIGIAGGIKLSPMFFTLYFLVSKQWRAAANSAVSFAGTAVIGFIVLPGESVRWWTQAIFDTSRIPDTDTFRNLSLSGLVKTIGMPDVWQRPAWLVLAIAFVTAAMIRAVILHKKGEVIVAALAVGAASTLVSPITWDHHLIWLPLAALSLVLSRRSRLWVAVGWALLLVLSFFCPIWTPAENPQLMNPLLARIPIFLTALLTVAGLPPISREHEVAITERANGESVLALVKGSTTR